MIALQEALEKLHEQKAQIERLTRQRDALVKVAEEAYHTFRDLNYDEPIDTEESGIDCLIDDLCAAISGAKGGA